MVQELFTEVTDPAPEITLEEAVAFAQHPDSEWHQPESPEALATVKAFSLITRNASVFGLSFEEISSLQGPVHNLLEHGNIIGESKDGRVRVCDFSVEGVRSYPLVSRSSVSEEQLQKWEERKATIDSPTR